MNDFAAVITRPARKTGRWKGVIVKARRVYRVARKVRFMGILSVDQICDQHDDALLKIIIFRSLNEVKSSKHIKHTKYARPSGAT